MEITVKDVKKLFNISIEDESMEVHLDRAIRDFKDEKIEEADYLEVVGCKCIYYLVPLLWSDMQSNANEYEESLDGYKDVAGFQKYWLNRSNSAIRIIKPKQRETITWGAI